MLKSSQNFGGNMERRNFLRKLFGISMGAAAVVAVPAIAKTKDEFTIDDMFDACDGNKQLFYLKKDSWLEKEIRDILGDRFVDEKYFNFYEPLFNCYLPIKEKYTKKDFENLLLVVKSKKFDYFCDSTGNNGSAMRIFKDEPNGYYRIDMYHARNPKNDY